MVLSDPQQLERAQVYGGDLLVHGIQRDMEELWCRKEGHMSGPHWNQKSTTCSSCWSLHPSHHITDALCFPPTGYRETFSLRWNTGPRASWILSHSCHHPRETVDVGSRLFKALGRFLIRLAWIRYSPLDQSTISKRIRLCKTMEFPKED